MIPADRPADTAPSDAALVTDESAEELLALGQPSRRLWRDPDYLDSCMPSSQRANLPPDWADEERPHRPHRRRHCDAELAAGRTKTSASGRTAYCCCGGRISLDVDGKPDGLWLARNSALATTSSNPTP